MTKYQSFTLQRVSVRDVYLKQIVLICDVCTKYNDFIRYEAKFVELNYASEHYTSSVSLSRNIEIHLDTKAFSDIRVADGIFDVTVQPVGFDADRRKVLYRIKLTNSDVIDHDVLDSPAPDPDALCEIANELRNNIFQKIEVWSKDVCCTPSCEKVEKMREVYEFLTKNI